jgi:bis(5'-nucleosyl)-tetraphosphatase (symmetrical)
VKTRATEPSRRIFIGDVQGCRTELEELLEAVRYDPAADALEPVGDLVNRGPDSLGVLRLLRSLGAGGVLGNHDVHCLRVSRGTRGAGPRDTLGELLAAPDRDELLGWLAQRPFARAWDDVVLVHAGVHPAWRDPVSELAGLDPYAFHSAAEFATRVRYCTATGERPPSDWPAPSAPYRPCHEFWEEREAEPRTLVFGHWARLGRMDHPRAKCLDSGCVWGKTLTAWIPEESRFVSVPARRVWSAPSEES